VNEPCEFLPWDSDFFGVRIGRVRGCRLTAARGADIAAWTDTHRIDCVYFLADADHPTTLRTASRQGFDLVDLRVTLAAVAAPTRDDAPASLTRVRPARADDIAALKQIARVSHRDSRFYADGRFDAGRCDELFATWIEKSCGGYADVVFVAESEGMPAGYISGHVAAGEHRGKIGLVGIDPARRRQGCARALVQSLLRWFVERGAVDVSVATQGRNAQALGFYQRNGFHVVSIELWYHRWSPGYHAL
jgi:dTDP-4-amino-4,6-dideoxy-D-galactose acyltransferase